ncbi:MAG: aminotransferase class III-fold pyridoxal phosphate-dependent enzyme [Marinicellaceae bacterium]
MRDLLIKEFDLPIVKVKELNGYDNKNYLITTTSSQFIFKTYKFDSKILDFIKAENNTLLFLNQKQANKYPKPIAFSDNEYIKTLDINGGSHICRMLSFIKGQFLAEIKHSETLFQSLGNFLAETSLDLSGYINHTIAARQFEWDIQYLNLNQKYIKHIPSHKDRNTVNYFIQKFHQNVSPLLPELRKQVIHNDANEWNVLSTNGEVSGLIDFGDLAHSPLINELAIAITYACYNKKEPLKWASIILKAYNKKCPLEETEIKILYYLIAARLVISVCNSAHSKAKNPKNSYASSSEINAWSMLYKWLAINPIQAENKFRLAANFSIKKPVLIEELLARRKNLTGKNLSLSYSDPIHMDSCAFQYMYDVNGNTFLDAYNNIPHVGHCHPKIVETGQRQMAQLNTNTRYLYNPLIDYSEKLLTKFPQSLNKVYFVNSGSAASDLAIRMAKAHTQHNNLMVMEHGYHGNTQSSIDISDYKFNNPKGQGQKDHIIKAKIPDTYRGLHKTDDVNAGQKYAIDAVNQIQNSHDPIAAFISEPIVGCGGQVPLAEGYLKHVYQAIRNQGGVCISDEVQTGFGRLGDYFWGFEAQNVVPDIAILGKPIANGHPMGVVVCSEAVSNSFDKGVEFFSSYGGNPVSCAIAKAVLEIIEDEKLQENAKKVGDYYKNLLMELQKKYSCIGDVRGSGLFLGVEIIKGNNMQPDTDLASYIKNQLRKRNILISTDGPYDSVLKSKPPLCFTKQNAKKVVSNIDSVISHYFS